MNPNAILEAYTSIGIKTGDALVVQSSYKGVSAIDGGPQAIIDALIELVGSSGTLIMPAYNFKSWTENHYFDSRETPSTVGIIAETFRLAKGVYRTRHPIHSLSVYGNLAKELSELDPIDSFGPDSVFSALIRVNAIYSTLGLGSEMPFLPCHLAETQLDVPYRRLKLFSGIYVDRNRQASLRTYGFHVRQLGATQNPVYECHDLLFKRKKIREFNQHGIRVNAASAIDYHRNFLELIQEKPELFK